LAAGDAQASTKGLVGRFPTLSHGETVALLGFDRAAAEILVHVITGATLPDAGDVHVFGSPTRDITNPDAWFALLDRCGILSERVALVDELTVEQNLALALSFEVDDLPPDVRRRVGELAAEIGIAPGEMREPMAKAGPATRLRIRLGRALAFNPGLLLAEHPTATLPPEEVDRFATDLSAAARRRSLAMLVLTADAAFARAVCDQVLSLRPATGELAAASGWRSWLTRRGR